MRISNCFDTCPFGTSSSTSTSSIIDGVASTSPAKYRGTNVQIQETLYSWLKKKIANTITKIDDCVKHNFLDTIRKLITGQTWWAEGQRKLIIVDRAGNTETWTATAAPRTMVEVDAVS